MSDTLSTVDPRERAAHIACAVVLTIVVVSVVVALIVYFTTDPVNSLKSCDVSNADPSGNVQANDNQVKRVDTQARKPPVARPAPKSQPARAASKPHPTRLAEDPSANASSFRSDSGLATAVTSNAGSTIRQAQGVTVNPRMEQFSDHLASFAQNFQGALASQNPAIAQLTETPNSIHRTYQGDINTPHLKQEYVDSTLFPKMVAEWRKQSSLPYGRTEAYNDAILGQSDIVVPGARV